MKHTRKLIVPVFITHFGCPHRCVFCDQDGITGSRTPPSADAVSDYLSQHLNANTNDAVIAFYGGSFTCLPQDVQEGYLAVSSGFIEKGLAASVRLSTRPDCVDADTAEFLFSRRVGTVELGAQSMDDRVLATSARGHTAADTARAAGVLKRAGMELGIQVMAGLPGDTHDGFMRTVAEVIGLGPAFVRVYPALVLGGAPLERLYRRGEYVPLGLEEAVGLCADACAAFNAAGIMVVRTGLQPSESLEAALVAGPYHPSFGHMVASELAFRRMAALIDKEHGPGPFAGIEFTVNPAELSTYLGIGKNNLEKLRLIYGPNVSVRPDGGVARGGLALRGTPHP